MCLNHENCLPRNLSVMPGRLGATKSLPSFRAGLSFCVATFSPYFIDKLGQ